MSSLKKSRKSKALAGASLISLMAITAAPASAQQAAASLPANDPGEIVITAQRREQRLQDVGIAVTALNGTALKQMNIQNASDLSRVVPTLKMNSYSSAQVVFNIRGVSQNDFGDQQEPPSLYIRTTAMPVR